MPPSADLPHLRARTGGFRRGQPRSAEVFGDAERWHVRYLASTGPYDPVLALRELDHTGRSSTLADPTALDQADGSLPDAERTRRERSRESATGITAFHSDRAGARSVFSLSGQLWVVDHVVAPRSLRLQGAVDPRLSPDGRWVACHGEGGVQLIDVDSGAASVLCPAKGPELTWGLAEFIAAEEMGRHHGMWWSPGSDRLLVTASDTSKVGTWWITDPAAPTTAPRSVRYPAAGTANAEVALFLVDLAGQRAEVPWDRERFPYLAAVRWEDAGALISVQTRDQTIVEHLLVEPDGSTRLLGRQQRAPWVELVPGSPRLTAAGELALVDVDPERDAWRLRIGAKWVTPPDLYVRSLLRCDEAGVWITGSSDPRDNHLFRLGDGGPEQLTQLDGWHTTLAAGPIPVTALARPGRWQPVVVVGEPNAPAAHLPNPAAEPVGNPRIQLLEPAGRVRVAVILPDRADPAPVIVSSYGGPHAQRAIRSPLAFATEQWFADCGFAVVVIDGRGSPGVSPSCEAAVSGDLASGVLDDQITGLSAASAAFPGRLDSARVGIRGWSFGGYLACLAVLKRPDVFHAAFAGAPVTEWRLYDTHYTERYLGDPATAAAVYDASSLLSMAAGLHRPLCLVHGLADDNVFAAHTLRLSAALTAHGRPHQVLPLPGISHMTPQESVTENLLRLELEFFERWLSG